MNTPDTQEVIVGDNAVRNVLASVLTPGLVPNPAPAPAKQAEPASEEAAKPNAETAPAEQGKAKEDQAEPAKEAVESVKAEVPKQGDEVAATEDPYEAIVNASIGTPEEEVEWGDEAKSAFKATFGSEDPASYKKEVEAKLTEGDLAKADLEKIKPVLEALNSLPPSMATAFKMAMDGKASEAQEFLRGLPSSVFLNKEADKMTDRELIDTYLPGKVSADQWDMLSDEDADEDVVDALKRKIAILKDSAATAHEQQRQGLVNARAEEEAARSQKYEAYKTSVASSVSAAKSSPLGALLDSGTQEKFTSGAFLSDFVQEDGVTPTEEAATRYLWAIHGEKLMKAADARGYARGRNEGLLEATSRQPENPPSQSRAVGGGDKPQTQEDQVRTVLWGALSRAQA